MKNNIAGATTIANEQPPRNINNEIAALQEIAEKLAKSAAELDNGTQCIRVLAPNMLKEPQCNPCPPCSSLANILNEIYNTLSATNIRLRTVYSELDLDFPPGQ